MVDIYTARYNYNGPDRLDITVKGKDPRGMVLAPTWDMVRKYQNGQEDEATYTKRYWTLMKERLVELNVIIQWIREQKEVTLVCFCIPGAFCHRVLLAKKLAEQIPDINYKGERKV